MTDTTARQAEAMDPGAEQAADKAQTAAPSADAVAAAQAFLSGGTPTKTTTYNNGKVDVPAKPSAIVTVTKANVKAALIDSGYYKATDFTGLQ